MTAGDQDNFDPLDDLLAAARWPAASPESTARLRDAYQAAAGRGAAIAWPVWVTVAAAAVIVSVGVWVGVMRNGETRNVKVVIDGVVAKPVPKEAAVVRQANAAEMAVVLTTARQRRPAMKTEVAEAPAVKPDVPAKLEAIAGKRGTAAALRELKAAPDRRQVVEQLFARLDDPRVEIKLAAAKALGYLDGPAVTARLAGMVEANRHRREALAALMQSDGREAREYLRRAAAESDLETAMRSVAVQVDSF